MYVSQGFTSSALQHSFGSANEVPFYLWGSSTSGLTKLSVTRPFGRAKTKWSQVGKLNDTRMHVCLSVFLILFCFWLCHMACGILFPWLGIETRPPALDPLDPLDHQSPFTSIHTEHLLCARPWGYRGEQSRQKSLRSRKIDNKQADRMCILSAGGRGGM